MTPKAIRDAANTPWEAEATEGYEIPLDGQPYCGSCGTPGASRNDGTHACATDCDHNGALSPDEMHEVGLEIGSWRQSDEYFPVVCSACGRYVYVTR